jgi:hypothetical protein
LARGETTTAARSGRQEGGPEGLHERAPFTVIGANAMCVMPLQSMLEIG